MKRGHLGICVICLIVIFYNLALAETIEVLIKGVDDGVKHSRQQDYLEAIINAKLQAIERAGVEIKSFTKVTNFKLKYDMIQSKAEALLLPGFQIMDLGYQNDGTYQVVLSGKVQVGKSDNSLSEREKAFQDLIQKGNEFFKSGNPQESLRLAKKALEIPGYKNDADAIYLQKMSQEEIDSRNKNKTIFNGKVRFWVLEGRSKSKEYAHPIDKNITAKLIIDCMNSETWSAPRLYDEARSEFNSWLAHNNPIIAKITLEASGATKELVIQANGLDMSVWRNYKNDYTKYYANSGTKTISANCGPVKFDVTYYIQAYEGYGYGGRRKHYYKIKALFVTNLNIERTDLPY